MTSVHAHETGRHTAVVRLRARVPSRISQHARPSSAEIDAYARAILTHEDLGFSELARCRREAALQLWITRIWEWEMLGAPGH